MITNSPLKKTPVIKFEQLNWVATEAMPRDQSQSNRLHEPKFRICTTDPITGHEVDDIAHHPSLVDGNMTMYFETEKSRKAYQDMPLNHPYLHLPYPAADDDDRGG